MSLHAHDQHQALTAWRIWELRKSRSKLSSVFTSAIMDHASDLSSRAA